LLQGDDPSFERFCEILQYIRYRGGILNGYLSRLHYTGEWLYDNQQKGVLQLPVLRESEPFHPSVSFMSAHCDRYPALKDHPDRRLGIRQIEDRVSRLPLRFIPKERLTSATDIRDGDVIAITTHIKGLDVSHVGFALCRNGVPFLLHASSEAGKVVVGVEPLHRYLAQRKNHSGIIVARSGRPERFK
ncbi:MAG: DUF1460 domain-containing protein, partial [Bacteroidales bacterium]|nr:DUF1460 domain-containing protein [Bacteroidales bacterium]